ncbi:MAG: hypothetical protein AB7G17_00655 [Phycisphaerales bacterium]
MIPREHEPMLNALARSAERANRPTSMVVFTALLLLAAVVFAGWSAMGARAASREFQREAAQRREVERAVSEIKALQAQRTQGAGALAAFAPEASLLSKMAQAATASGLTTPPQIQPPNREEMPGSPLIKQVVTARADGQEPSAVFAWLKKCLEDIPGLYVSQFALRPTRLGWSVEIRFARWEIKS